MNQVANRLFFKQAECLIRRIASDTIPPPLADVAQPVEQRIRNAWVSGSNPLIGSINSMTCVAWMRVESP